MRYVESMIEINNVKNHPLQNEQKKNCPLNKIFYVYSSSLQEYINKK